MVTPSFGVSRTFDTNLERLWAAFTEEDDLEAWYMPPDCQVLLSRMKLDAGGMYRYGFETPDGLSVWGRWDIRRVEPRSLMTFAQYFTSDAGALARNPHDPAWPRWLKTEFRFALQGGGATVTINLAPENADAPEIAAFRKGFLGLSQGWERALDALSARLSRP